MSYGLIKPDQEWIVSTFWVSGSFGYCWPTHGLIRPAWQSRDPCSLKNVIIMQLLWIMHPAAIMAAASAKSLGSAAALKGEDVQKHCAWLASIATISVLDPCIWQQDPTMEYGIHHSQCSCACFCRLTHGALPMPKVATPTSTTSREGARRPLW